MSMRQSGRTTTMLHQAAAAAEWGHVLVVTPSRSIMEHCQRLARDAGIDLTNIEFATAQWVLMGKYRGFNGPVFEDHTVWDDQHHLQQSTQSALRHEIHLISSGWPQLHSTDPDEQERLELRERLSRSQGLSN